MFPIGRLVTSLTFDLVELNQKIPSAVEFTFHGYFRSQSAHAGRKALSRGGCLVAYLQYQQRLQTGKFAGEEVFVE